MVTLDQIVVIESINVLSQIVHVPDPLVDVGDGLLHIGTHRPLMTTSQCHHIAPVFHRTLQTLT